MKIGAVILAAGQGTRLNSSLPKVLHALNGKALIDYSLSLVAEITGNPPVVVVGHLAAEVEKAIGNRAQCVLQEPQLGTGDAVRKAAPLLDGAADLVLVIYGDMPLLTSESLLRLVETQKNNSGPISMLTVESNNPRGFGRVIRMADGTVKCIVEEAQATPEQLAVRELNVGTYCFDARWLWVALDRIPLSPKGEYYLTDAIGIAVSEGQRVQAICMEDEREAMGINTRIHLAEAEAVIRQRINEKWMLAGVTIIDPAATYIEEGVQIGADTVIFPNTFLRGKTVIGRNCRLGPGTIIADTRVGDGCTLLQSVLEGAVLENNVSMGPFGHLRKGAHLGEGVHLGNFGEVKDSYLGPGTKMGHFSYIGNATIGSDVNIGAGTITCNYDGVRKNPTEIGDDAFIGSDTMLVAPVKIGKGAHTGAGAVVTHDVPPGDTVIGVPARSIKK